jgi:hypothetical protein
MLTRRPVRYVQTFSPAFKSLAGSSRWCRLNVGRPTAPPRPAYWSDVGRFELIPPDAFFFFIYKKIPPASDKVNLILIEGSPSLSRPRHNEVSADDEWASNYTEASRWRGLINGLTQGDAIQYNSKERERERESRAGAAPCCFYMCGAPPSCPPISI